MLILHVKPIKSCSHDAVSRQTILTRSNDRPQGGGYSYAAFFS
jgi:hypothetical protein